MEDWRIDSEGFLQRLRESGAGTIRVGTLDGVALISLDDTVEYLTFLRDEMDRVTKDMHPEFRRGSLQLLDALIPFVETLK